MLFFYKYMQYDDSIVTEKSRFVDLCNPAQEHENNQITSARPAVFWRDRK